MPLRPHGAGAMNKRENKKMKKPRLTDSDRLAIETGLKSGKTVYMIAKELSRPVTTVQRFRIWGMDALRRVHRVGNLSPAEAAESAEGGFGQSEPPRPSGRV